MRRPGTRLRSIAARWCSARTMERLVDPVLADLQTEYGDAARAGRVWRSRWIWMTGHVAFAKAIACHGAERAMGTLRGLTVDDRRALIRTIWFGFAAMLVGTALLALLPFVSLIAGTLSERVRLTAYVMPAFLPITIPIGVTFGILWGLGRGSATPRSRRLVLLLAVVFCLVSFAILAWIGPATNQAFRVGVARTLGVSRL